LRRRFLRPVVIALCALGLALGAGFGLAAPAFGGTDTGFSAQIDPDTLPVTTDSDVLAVSGTKSEGTLLTAFNTTDGSTFSGCVGLSAASQAWSCELSPSERGWQPGNEAMVISETNEDGTVVQNEVPFDVYEDAEAPDWATAPVVGYSFIPGGANLTATTQGTFDNASGIQTFYQYGEGYYAGQNCPDDVNDDFPAGTDESHQFQVSCSPTYPGGALVTVISHQESFGDGDFFEDDSTYGYFYVENNSIVQVNAATVDADAQTVTVTGSAYSSSFDNSSVVLLNDANAIVCPSATFTPDDSFPDGTVDDWTCTTSALGYGAHTISASVQDQGAATIDDFAVGDNEPYGVYLTGGLSPATAIGTVTFSAPGSTTTPATPATPQGLTIPNWSFTVDGELTNLHPGDTITISGTGLPGGTTLDSILHSVPTDLGTVVAAADGTFTQTVTIPNDVGIGAHTIEVTATGPGLTTTTKQQAITVTSVPAAASGGSGKTNVDTTKPTATHGASGGESGTAIAPNILTRALTPFADVALHPNKIVSAFEIGLVLLLLAVLPAHLLNATISEQSERFERRFGKIRAPGWLTRLVVWFKTTPVVGAVVVTLVAAILFGFADPKFGFTLASLRLILACAIALFFVGYVANALTGVIARVQWNVVSAISSRPYGLILTVVGVLISRLLHFSPGFLIGLILGLTIQEKSAAIYAWRTIVLRSSIVLLMAIAAWIGYSTLTLGGNEGGTFGSALLVETLVAITTEGVVALLVELLPLTFLEGQRIYDHSRVLWGIFYVLTIVVFVLAVVPWEGNWDALHGSLWVWIVVLAVFAAICVGVYIYFRRFAPPEEAENENEEVPLGEAVKRDRL
jgi:hypothetical protein